MNCITGNSGNKRVLISGGGIAGLTLGILLRRQGWDPLVIERDAALRTEGYIVDIFGTGWDIAERIGVIDALKEVRYPLDYMEYISKDGRPFLSIEMARLKQAFGNKYLPLQRSDLERVLFERAKSEGLSVRFGTQVRNVRDNGSLVEVEFEDNSRDSFSLVFGADGVHSRIRQMVFGREEQFARFLGAYVAAFQAVNKYGIKRSIKFFEEPGRLVAFYPLSDSVLTTIYIFRSGNSGFIPRAERLSLIQNKFKGAGWICRRILEEVEPSVSVFLDSYTQIVMPSWSKGRIALLGDACGCLTMVSGQGSQVAMGEAYVISRELEYHRDDFAQAFRNYEKFYKPMVSKKQNDAARFLKIVIPPAHFPSCLRRSALRIIFRWPFINLVPMYFGSKSALKNY